MHANIPQMNYPPLILPPNMFGFDLFLELNPARCPLQVAHMQRLIDINTVPGQFKNVAQPSLEAIPDDGTPADGGSAASGP